MNEFAIVRWTFSTRTSVSVAPWGYRNPRWDDNQSSVLGEWDCNKVLGCGGPQVSVILFYPQSLFSMSRSKSILRWRNGRHAGQHSTRPSTDTGSTSTRWRPSVTTCNQDAQRRRINNRTFKIGQNKHIDDLRQCQKFETITALYYYLVIIYNEYYAKTDW